jgi:hypothetical protein
LIYLLSHEHKTQDEILSSNIALSTLLENIIPRDRATDNSIRLAQLVKAKHTLANTNAHDNMDIVTRTHTQRVATIFSHIYLFPSLHSVAAAD